MSLINFDASQLEIIKKYFQYIVIIILASTNIYVFNLYVTVEENRIKDAREQSKIYEQGYFRTNDILQNYIKYETIKVYDTISNVRFSKSGLR